MRYLRHGRWWGADDWIAGVIELDIGIEIAQGRRENLDAIVGDIEISKLLKVADRMGQFLMKSLKKKDGLIFVRKSTFKLLDEISKVSISSSWQNQTGIASSAHDEQFKNCQKRSGKGQGEA